jgi:hypothetical protein
MRRQNRILCRRSSSSSLHLELLETRNLLSGSQLQFAVGELSVQEGATAQIPVARTGDATGPVSVDYSIAVPGNLLARLQATAGTDFQGSLSGTVAFLDGQVQQNLAIPITADDLLEATEQFRVTLKNPTGGATLGPQIALTVSIQDQNLPIVPYAPPNPPRLESAAVGIGDTAEYSKNFVTNTYQKFLQRQPDAGGLNFWSTAFRQYSELNHVTGLNESQIEGAFLASPEYVNRFGGVGAGWVRSLYHEVLNRDTDENGLQFWLASLAGGTSAADVALRFSNSTEALSNGITAAYQTLLERAPDPAGQSFWLNFLLAGNTTEEMSLGFVAKPEYYDKLDGAAGNPAGWVREVYLDLLHRPGTEDAASQWVSTIDAEIPAEIPDLDRLARFVPNKSNPYVPQASDWVKVDKDDSNLKGDVIVVAHGFAYGYGALVQNYDSKNNAILKWWQTIDPKISGDLGPNASEMFIGANNGGSPPTDITPTGLANAILAADPKAIVLAYSWLDESAYDSLYNGEATSEAYTHMNGVRLAHALEQALPADFHSSGGALHLIGHSHGSKVATVAAVTLQDDGKANDQLSHLTILDSPEDDAQSTFDTNSSNMLWYYLGKLNIGTGSGQTFVDNYISYLGEAFGPIQGFDPLDTTTKSPSLQNVVDVNLTAGTNALSLSDENSHAYAFNWYAGAIQKWASNTKPESVLGGESVLNPSDLGTLDGSYAQAMKKATDPQFSLTAGNQHNTESVSTSFTDLTFTSQSVTTDSTYDSSGLTLKETGKGTGAGFTGKFDVVGGRLSGQFSGISFNYHFTTPGEGDQLLIYVNTGSAGGQELHYAMTGTVAGTHEQFATLSLGSLAHHETGTIEIQLVSPSGSTGAAVTITNMQQFTEPY